MRRPWMQLGREAAKPSADMAEGHDAMTQCHFNADASLRLRLSPRPCHPLHSPSAQAAPTASKRCRQRYTRASPSPNTTLIRLWTASEPIELTSDDEPNPSPPKRKRKRGRTSSLTDVIDLCADDREVAPRPPRKSRKSAPRKDEVIVLLSSDNEEPNSKAVNNGHSQAASLPPIEILHPEESDFATDTANASEQPELLAPQIGSSPASPVAESPSDKHTTEVLPDEDRRTSGPLQHIYNEAFQNTSQSNEMDICSPVFSWKARPKPNQNCEPRHLPLSNPPLLTPSFFKRIQNALSAPQKPTSSVQNDLPKGSPPNLRPPTPPVKSDLVPATSSNATSEVGERGSPSQTSTILDKPMPQKSLPECVTAVKEITEDNPLGISPAEVVEAGALRTASPPSPVKEVTPSAAPQSEVTAQLSTYNGHDTSSTIDVAHQSSSTSSPKNMTTSKIEPTASWQKINGFGRSEADIQEIEAMLLPEASDDMTDEELLAMGLCYPEY